MKFLIFGLGNIGNEFIGTRHNIGFDICDWTNTRYDGGEFKSDKFVTKSEIKIRGRKVILLKPTTYMNLSGKAVRYWIEKEKVSIENILIILDDLALPLAKIRLKTKGSDGGHNGLKSIQEELRTTNYPRFRFGIGNDFSEGKQVDFVLGRWSSEEILKIRDNERTCTDVIESFVFRGMTQTMNYYN